MGEIPIPKAQRCLHMQSTCLWVRPVGKPGCIFHLTPEKPSLTHSKVGTRQAAASKLSHVEERLDISDPGPFPIQYIPFSHILLPLLSPNAHQLLSIQIIPKPCSSKGQHGLIYNQDFSKPQEQSSHHSSRKQSSQISTKQPFPSFQETVPQLSPAILL